MSFHTGVGIARQPEPQSRLSPILDRGEGRSAIGTAEALGAAVGDRPYVGNPDGDLDAAGAAAAGLANDGDEVLAALDDLLRLDAELLEAIEP